MPQKKILCVVTGTRAEYGLLRGVLRQLFARTDLETRLVATGAHLAPAFGETVHEIEADGFALHARIPILKFGTGTPLATARTVASALEQFTAYFSQNRPDAVLVLGDRYEIFAVGQAAALLEIPLIHISGGDVTHGAADDYFRHCLTKMASLHFPSCEVYAQRLIRMGEQPDTVYNVGGLGDQNLRSLPLLEREALAQSLEFDLSEPYGLVTFHPETAGGASPVQQCDELLAALEETGLRCIFTKANADAGGGEINRRIDAACAAAHGRWIAFTSMGVLRYLSAMRYCAAVIGNSSSGVVETPTLGVPAVNIGERQTGRILCPNVLCCPAQRGEIAKAVRLTLTPAFRARAAATQSPYSGGDTAGKIAQITADFLHGDRLGQPKQFYDPPQGETTL